MINLSAKVRQELGKKVKNLRKEGFLPATLYGSKTENQNLEIDLKEFEKIYQQAGESSLISLEIKSSKEKQISSEVNKKIQVLINEVQYHPLSKKPLHVDFYQPSLKEEIEVKVSLVFDGVSLAVKELSGTLVKNISEVEVKALAQNLPHEIRVDVSKIKTFEDKILIKDLIIGKEVKILKDPEEIVAFVARPEKVEEELEKPIEENVEEVQKTEKKKEKEEIEE